MGIVQGFSDVIQPNNLLFNGSFRINQRDSFATLQDVAVGDYVSDCWYVSGLNYDYAQVHNNTSFGHLRVKGYGKKGQYLTIQNKASNRDILTGVYANYTPFTRTTITMTAQLHNTGSGTNIVSMRSVCPYITSYYNVIFENSPNTKPNSGNRSYQISQTDMGMAGTYNYPALVIYLMADGGFDYTVQDAALVVGGYKSLPYSMQIPYADDLLRCKRYYQTGYAMPPYITFPVCIDNGSASVTFGNYLQFPVEMAGTPSVSVSFLGSGGNIRYKTTTAASIFQTESSSGWTVSLAYSYPKWFSMYLQRSTYLANMMCAGPSDSNSGIIYTATV